MHAPHSLPHSKRRTGRTRRIGKAWRKALHGSAALTLLLCGAAHADATLPNGGRVVLGSADLSSAPGDNGGISHITQGGPHLIINWDSFNIAEGKQVVFRQPYPSAVALNRVIGNSASQILGQLNANGQVFLVNPNGILFGPNSQINVGALAASTLALSNRDFLGGRNYRYATQGKSARVVNQGSLNARAGGFIALVGGQVDNQGTMQAPGGTIAMAAGKAVTLTRIGNGALSVQIDEAALDTLARDGQALQALGTQSVSPALAEQAMLRAAVNDKGLIEAATLTKQGSLIVAVGQGAKITAGGVLDVSAHAGHAGQIQLYGQTVAVTGDLLARAAGAGNGGRITLSGGQLSLADASQVDTRSAPGRTGWLTLESNRITVAPDAAAGQTRISAAALARHLGRNNVSLASTQADLQVNEAVAWNNDHTLSLSARDNILLAADIQARGRRASLALAHGENADYRLGKDVKVTLSGADAGFSLNGQAYAVIHDARQLPEMESNLAGRYVLGNDIDASDTRNWNQGSGFRPVGQQEANSFRGTLAGLGNAIDGLYIKHDASRQDSTFDNLGLFGVSSGTVRDLDLKDLYIASEHGARAIGGLAGQNQGVIRQVRASGRIASMNSDAVGGLVGENRGLISHVSFDGEVTNRNTADHHGGNLGGLAGMNSSKGARIEHAIARATVRGDDAAPGGLVGVNAAGAEISDSLATGEVWSNNFLAGGLVGLNADGRILRSEASGPVISNGKHHNILVGLNVGVDSDIVDSKATYTPAP